jgi:hypothetical protein
MHRRRYRYTVKPKLLRTVRRFCILARNNMPRPRIRPEDRQRAVIACIPCKTSKKRCDSMVPCGHCVKRDCTFACIYHDAQRVQARNPPSRPFQARVAGAAARAFQKIHISSSSSKPKPREPGSVLPRAPLTTNGPQPNGDSVAENEALDEAGYEEGGTSHAAEEVPSLPRSRVMLNRKGERGRTSPLTC